MTWKFISCESMREYLANDFAWKNQWSKDKVRISVHQIHQFGHGLVTDWLWATMYSWAEEDDDHDLDDNKRCEIFDQRCNWCDETFGPSAYDFLEDGDGELLFQAILHPDRKWAAHGGSFYFRTETEEMMFKMRFG